MFKFRTNLANGTTIHGLRDLITSKNKSSMIFWIIIMTGAFCMTIIQTYQVMDNFFSDETYTVVEPATERDIVYPSVKVCFVHWIYWVDWQKAKFHGFSKEMVLFSLSYITEIDSFVHFNIRQTKVKFLHQMARKNLSHLSDFYKLIAIDFPMVIFDDLSWWTNETRYNFHKLFKSMEIIPTKHDSLCYIAEREQVEMFHRVRPTNNGSQFSFAIHDQNYRSLQSSIDKSEYNYYILQYLKSFTNYYDSVDFNDNNDAVSNDFALPMHIYSDGYSYFTDIGFDSDWYFYKVSMSGYRLKHSNSKPCDPKLKLAKGNATEEWICQSGYQGNSCNCMHIHEATLVQNDYPDVICHKRIRFVVNNSFIIDTDQKTKKRICVENTTFTKILQNCLNRVPVPCETWIYTSSEDQSKFNSKLNKFMVKNYTNVFISYPNPSQVLITTEIDAQTWQHFIGSIGGVIGIWTGASVISFIQLIYLFLDSLRQSNKLFATNSKNSFNDISVLSTV